MLVHWSQQSLLVPPAQESALTVVCGAIVSVIEGLHARRKGLQGSGAVVDVGRW